MYERACARNRLEVHSSGATHCSTRCCTTGTPLHLLLPSLSDHELLESGGEYLLRREGREREEERGGGVLDLPASASRGTGLEPRWPDLLLRLPVSFNSAQHCSCTDLLLRFTSFSDRISHWEPRSLLLFWRVDLVTPLIWLQLYK